MRLARCLARNAQRVLQCDPSRCIVWRCLGRNVKNTQRNQGVSRAADECCQGNPEGVLGEAFVEDVLGDMSPALLLSVASYHRFV